MSEKTKDFTVGKGLNPIEALRTQVFPKGNIKDSFDYDLETRIYANLVLEIVKGFEGESELKRDKFEELLPPRMLELFEYQEDKRGNEYIKLQSAVKQLVMIGRETLCDYVDGELTFFSKVIK